VEPLLNWKALYSWPPHLDSLLCLIVRIFFNINCSWSEPVSARRSAVLILPCQQGFPAELRYVVDSTTDRTDQGEKFVHSCRFSYFLSCSLSVAPILIEGRSSENNPSYICWNFLILPTWSFQTIAGSTTSISSIGAALKIGDRVIVSSQVGGSKTGTLRFSGTTHFAQGEWAGVELVSF